MEIQLTDFENAAFTTFITLLTRVILTFDLNLYIPLSRVDANMQRAHSRNASLKGKFFFRRHMAPLEIGDDGFDLQYNSMFSTAVNGMKGVMPTIQSDSNFSSFDSEPSRGEDGVSQKRRVSPNASGGAEENSYEEMTMAEIMTGKGGTQMFFIDFCSCLVLVSHCIIIYRPRLLPWSDTFGICLSRPYSMRSNDTGTYDNLSRLY